VRCAPSEDFDEHASGRRNADFAAQNNFPVRNFLAAEALISVVIRSKRGLFWRNPGKNSAALKILS